MPKLTRRAFLKSTALGTTAVSISPIMLSELFSTPLRPVSMDDYKKYEDGKWSYTICNMCFWTCGVKVKSVNGVVKKIEGIAGHPLNNGKICAKGNAGIAALYDEDRVKYPLLRVGEKGEDKWKRISWDDAFNIITEKVKPIMESNPEKIHLASHGHGGSNIKYLLKAMGSSNIYAASWTQCKGSREVAWDVTYGHHLTSYPLYDYENSKYVINFGRNLLEALMVGETGGFLKFIENGGKYVYLDPRFTTTAAKAYKWFPIKPGADLAFALGIIRVIIDEELYDKNFVQKATVGFDKLKEFIEKYSVEWAAKETDIPKEQIFKTAREFAAFKPACIAVPPRRNARYGVETQTSRAIAIINALMGNYGKKGGFFLPAKVKVKPYPGIAFPKSVRVDGAGKGNTSPLGDLGEGFINSLPELTDKGMVESLFVYGTNLITNMAETTKVINMLKKIPFTVTIETQMTETALYSDIILPEATYLERDDNLRIGNFPYPFISLCSKAVEPLYESKPAWWIAKSLGLKLGLDDYFDFKDIEEVNEKRINLSGFDYNKLKKEGFISFNDKRIYEDDPEMLFFRTPSNKIELYSSEFEENGFNPLPEYQRVPQPPEGTFRLTVGRVSAHTHARTQNNKWLTELYPENMVWINTEDAKKLNLKNGDYIKLVVENYKSDKVIAYVTQRIRRGIVFAAHGFGRLSKGLHRTYRKGVFDNLLIQKPAFDPISHSQGYENTFVKIEKA